MTDRVPIDEVVHFDVVTHSPTTGAVTDADSTPTFEVFEEATDTDIGVGGNLTKRTSKTGDYRGTFTASAANGFEAGKWYSVIASATVGAVAAKAVAKSFIVVPAESSAGVPKVETSIVSNGAITAATIATDAIDNDAIAANAVTEIQAGLATSAALAAVAVFVDTEIAAILALLDDPRAEPGQGAPPASADLATKIDYLYKFLRNKKTQSATQLSIFNDAETVVDHKAPISQASGSVTRGEVVSGP